MLSSSYVIVKQSSLDHRASIDDNMNFTTKIKALRDWSGEKYSHYP
jgi:hypothetical protein